MNELWIRNSKIEEYMGRLEKIKHLFYTIIIVGEWIECGEFAESHRVVVVGDLIDAQVINIMLKKENIKVYYCSPKDFEKKYREKEKVKWVLLDDSVRKWRKSSTDIIVMPKL